MALALLTFVFTLTVVLGSYWAVVMRPETAATGRLRQRLRVTAEQQIGAASIVKSHVDRTAATGLFRRWHRTLAVAPTERLVERAGMTIDAARLVSCTAAALVLIVLLLTIVQTNFMVAVGAGGMTSLVPYLYLRRAAAARMRAFEELFPDAIELMARALRAGHALTTTIAMVADEIPEPVKSEFRLVYEQHNYGLPLPQVLKALAARIPLMDLRFFVTAVLTQRDTGGNLAEVLDNLAAVTRDRFRVRRELLVLTAQGRMTGWILAFFPVALALVLYLVNPSHMNAFLDDPLGVRLLEIAFALQVIGSLIIRKIVTVEY
jgi:tight adherence protein B